MDEALQRQKTLDRVRRYRGKKALQEPISEGVTKEGSVTEALHPILEWLIDPVKRGKMENICESLGRRGLQGQVYYGCRRWSLSFDIVEDLLQATR